MKLNRRKHYVEEVERPMSVRIRRRAGAGGPVELKISGCAHTGDMEELRSAIGHFEKVSYMKCYLDLGKTTHLCADAIEEIAGLSHRIEERGDMFDVVDMSAEAELEIRAKGLQDVIRPLYPWPYSATGA